MTAAAIVFVTSASFAAAQDHGAHAAPKPVVQAFEHYEGVRVALSADKLADVAPHAKQLAAIAEAAGGAEAKTHADALVAATTIEDARTHFGELSTILVPKFQAEAIPGMTAYLCSMVQKPWAQRGDKIENPYYGKSMLACGSPLPPKK
jgi:Cu(I)/Ag(I) efflux system membrane fusion protein